MSSAGDFLSKFGGGDTEDVSSTSTVLSAGAPNALGAFMDVFSTMSDSFWFYSNTIELRFSATDHQYFRVEELGNLTPVKNVTTILHVIDKSFALVPWSCRVFAEELLRTIPLSTTVDEFGSLMLASITLEDFTKLVMAAKDTHKRVLTNAGDLGHLAHKCLEDSIQHAMDHESGIVTELRNMPEDPKAAACALAAFRWMNQHKVRWLKTEQKIYSKEFEYAGTMDGKCLVTSCDDPTCCTESFTDSLSIADWKSSNALHTEYILQVAGAYAHAEHEEYGEDIQHCFILRLGKNEDEAGKFEPWRIPARDFPEAFAGFLYSLQLTNIIESINKRMSSQKKGMRAIRKQIAAEQKEIAKMKAKVEKAEAKAKLKIERTAEKERIKADAKRVREEAKLGKGVLSTLSTGTVSGSETSNTGVQLVLDEPVNEIPGKAEDTPNVALVEEVANETSKMPEETSLLHGEQPRAAGNTPTLDYEEPQVERKLLVILMEEK
jgi:hypothetical protein